MCFGGGGVAKVKEPEYKNRPVTVTGEQTGVDNPKDTEKATERLKIKRQKKEGTYKDPNLTTADTLTRSGGNSFKNKLRSERKSGPTTAQKMARARLSRKFKSSPTGRKTGVA
tara:strand:- start:539 stop:877 length:339 start_codon:yes stop_codon:yes gene_type:complete